MTTLRDEYHDPGAVGSLRGALHTWRTLHDARREAVPSSVRFTLSCRSEARAHRVAGFLRRRIACRVTQVHHVAGAHRDTCHVHGSTHREVQSLTNLQYLWTWLRCTADSDQVALLRIAVAHSKA